MRGKLIFCCIFFLVLISSPVLAYEALPATVRVGLESQFYETNEIPIDNTAIMVGYGVGDFFLPQAMLQSAVGFHFRAADGHAVQGADVYVDYEQARLAAAQYTSSQGVYAPMMFGNGIWTVYGIGFATKNTAENAAEAIGGQYIAVSNTWVVLYAGNTAVAIFDNDLYNVQVQDAYGGWVVMNDRPYRDTIEIGRYQGNRLTAVSVVGLEAYLYSVVPSEMPATWSLEALKAQAVAARSYTLTRMGSHKASGYDLCDKGHCQLYLGAGSEAAATNQAVDETGGQVARYDGQPIIASYFSSSGGVTENSEHVWTDAVPYLRSVTEITEYEPRQWTRSFSLAEITALLTAGGFTIGTAVDVAITGVNDNGRVAELTITGTMGSIRLQKEAIRTFFATSEGGSLESRNFTMLNDDVSEPSPNLPESQPVLVSVTDGQAVYAFALSAVYAVSAESTPVHVAGAFVYGGGDQTVFLPAYTVDATTPVAGSNPDSGLGSGGAASAIVFVGNGLGHGVGMSQRGAEGMARLGFDYKTILQFYYAGITVE